MENTRGRTASLAPPRQPGQSGNQNGRPKGARNRFAERFIDDFMQDWEANGAETIAKVRTDKPDVYLRTAAAILPKQFDVNIDDIDSSAQSTSTDALRQLKLERLRLLQAKVALLERERAQRSLLAFTEATHPAYVGAGRHERIANALEAVERGDIDRLMIFMPPRHGKSELASRRFPAWYLGRDPKRQLIAASYNSDGAGLWARRSQPRCRPGL